jgi:hypothetical protein
MFIRYSCEWFMLTILYFSFLVAVTITMIFNSTKVLVCQEWGFYSRSFVDFYGRELVTKTVETNFTMYYDLVEFRVVFVLTVVLVLVRMYNSDHDLDHRVLFTQFILCFYVMFQCTKATSSYHCNSEVFLQMDKIEYVDFLHWFLMIRK